MLSDDAAERCRRALSRDIFAIIFAMSRLADAAAAEAAMPYDAAARAAAPPMTRFAAELPPPMMSAEASS